MTFGLWKFTVGDPMAFPIVKIENKTPNPLSVGLRWPPSNTAMPRLIARTSVNRSSDGWGTVAYVHRKVPIGYYGVPQMRPQKYPLPWTDLQNLPHPWARLTYDAKGHPDPIRCFSTMHWTDRPADRPTDRQTDRQIVHGKVWWL